jgi:hypothetical protein
VTEKRILIPRTVVVGMRKQSGLSSNWAEVTAGGTDSASRNRVAAMQSRNSNCYEFENAPLTGFCLGGSAEKYTMRVMDPRGFEVAIQVDDMMDTIKTCTVIDGQIQQQLVYGRARGKNVLVNTSSERYQTSVLQTELANSRTPWKKAKLGNRVSLTNGKSGIWLGQHYLLTLDLVTGYYHRSDDLNKIKTDSTKRHVLLVDSKSGPELYFSHTAKLARIENNHEITPLDAEERGNGILRQYMHNIVWNSRVIGMSLAEFDLSCIRLDTEPSLTSSKAVVEIGQTNLLGIKRNGRVSLIDQDAWACNRLVLDGKWLNKTSHRWEASTVPYSANHMDCVLKIMYNTPGGTKICYEYSG